MKLLQTLLAFVGGAVAAVLWLERRTSGERTSATPSPTHAPEPERPKSEREVERVVEEVVVADPEQAERIAQLEAELAEQRATREPPPDEPPPSVDAIRAARARAFALERELLDRAGDAAPRWSDLDPVSLEDPDKFFDAVAAHLPNVALRLSDVPLDAAALWPILGAMQEFADASRGDWFEYPGDFARWCVEGGHPAALAAEQLGEDQARPTFSVDRRVNRSGRMSAPCYVEAAGRRYHYVDDLAGETGRMQIVGALESGG